MPPAELVRMRCSTDGRDVYTTWQGQVKARTPGAADRVLFKIAGMNVARCLYDGTQWHMTSRELMLYLEPTTGAVLERWTNPWTQATVPVVHVANRVVQHQMSRPVPITIARGRAIADLNIPVRYPNPLARDPALHRYSPAPMYEATERFRLEAPAAALERSDLAAVPELTIRWARTGPWLPWMDMGERPGELVYEATGARVEGLDHLPRVLRDEITQRAALFAQAPRCVVDAKNETSWTYFARHIDAYHAGARFPIPEQARADECPAAEAAR